METERVRRAHRTAASANGGRAEQTAPPSLDASRPLPASQILHWASVYFIIMMAGLILTSVVEWIAVPNLLSSQLYETVSPQTVLIASYFARLVLWLALSTLWIRLTYKRFAYSKPWKIVAPLTILLVPVLSYLSITYGMLPLVEDASSTVLSVSVVYLISGLLFTLIPLVYYGWILWNEQSERNHGQVLQRGDTPKAGRYQGMHWAVVLLTIVASNAVLFLILDLLGRGSNAAITMNGSELAVMFFYGLYVIVFIWLMINGMLWIRLTRKRYAGSVNWQACTMAFWVQCVVLFYSVMDGVIAVVLPDMAGHDGAITIPMPTGMVIASMLGFLLPLLYYWRVIRLANAKSDDRASYALVASGD